MFAVSDPASRGGRIFARGNGRGMTDHGNQLPLTLHVQAQNTKAVLFIVVRDALNESGEVVEFSEGRIGHGEFRGRATRRHQFITNERPADLRANAEIRSEKKFRMPLFSLPEPLPHLHPPFLGGN